MGKFINLIGQRYGRLTVLNIAVSRNGKNNYWKCLCDCGNRVEPRGTSLKRGGTKSCGCLRKEMNALKQGELSAKSLRPFESLFNHSQDSAKREGHKFNLTYEQFLDYTRFDKCHYCYSTVFWAKYSLKKNGSKYNLDRKDNSLGYSVENCIACCTRCNFAKGNRYSYKEWYRMTQCFRDDYEVAQLGT